MSNISKEKLFTLYDILQEIHTTSNDIYWDDEDNHKYPYPVYHSKMRNWAKDCGIKG